MSNVEDFNDDDENFYYEVEEILDMRIKNSVTEYLIKWKNYGPEHNTWEPDYNLNCPTILADFISRQQSDNTSSSTAANKNDNEKEQHKKTAETEEKVKKKKTKKNKLKDKSKQPARSIENEKSQGKAKERAVSVEVDKSQGKDKERAQPTEDSMIRDKEPEENRKQELVKKKVEFRKDDTKKRDQSTIKKQTEDIAASDPKKRPVEQTSDIVNKRKKFGNHLDTPSNSSSSSSEPLAKTFPAQTFTNLKRTAAPPAKVVELGDLITIAKKTSSAYPTSPSTKYPISPTPIWPRTTPKPLAINPAASHISSTSSTTPTTPSFPTTSTPPQTFHTPPTSPLLQPSHHHPHHPPNRSVDTPMEWQIPSQRHRTAEASDSSSPLRQSFNKSTHGLGVAIQNKSPPPPPSFSAPISNSNPLVIRSENLHPIKRQSSRPDPRLISENVKKLKIQNATAMPTPFKMEILLNKGDRLISAIILEGMQSCFHEKQIKKLISLVSKNNVAEIRISSFLPLKRLDDYLADRPFSTLSISPKSHIVDLSKLKSFMQVNETVGVMSHPDMPTQALVVLPEAELKKLSNMPTDTGLPVSSHIPLCALFIDDLPPRPKMLLEHVEDVEEDLYLFSFNRVANFLKFPDELKKLKSTHKFIAYGSSEVTSMLSKVIKNQNYEPKANPAYVMLFDRFKDSLFSKSLTKHKKEPTTQIWEFGIADLLSGQIMPACRTFPDNSGGFVTTDIHNIIQNPAIIDVISTQIEKFEEYPLVYGDWKFILPYNFIFQMKRAIRDEKTAEMAQLAMVAITVALSKGKVQVMRLWPPAKDDTSAIQYMNHVIRNYYKYRQYFVYVDDIGSLSSEVKERFPSLDFVQSKRLYSTFS